MVVTHTGLELGAAIYWDYTILTKPEIDIDEIIQEQSPVENIYNVIKTSADKEVFFRLCPQQI